MNRKLPLPLAVMLLLNFIPLIGVIYWGWTIFYVVYLYWFESLLLAFFTALKIIFAKGTVSYRDTSPWGALTAKKPETQQKSNLSVAVGYFIRRVLLLMFYFIFIIVFVGIVVAPKGSAVDVLSIVVFNNAGFNRVILAFILSQLLDFGYNYILNRENEHTHPYDLNVMFDVRTVVIHVVIVLGGVLSLFAEKQLGEGNHITTYAYVIIFVIVKTVADIVSYNKERGKALQSKNAAAER